jgi:phage repressor protein C with HTH and peptisase S24 domain
LPTSFGLPGYEMSKQQRIAALVAMVGGPVKAAALVGKNRGTIDHWRKEGADPPLEAILPLCIEAQVSLDWVATGHQVRPDLSGAASIMPSGYVELPPVVLGPSAAPFAVTHTWLSTHGALSIADAAYFVASDDGMAPLLPKGALGIVDRRHSRLHDGHYAVVVEGDVLARRLNRLPNGTIELVADNFPAWRYSLGGGPDVPLYRVVWAGRDL